MSKLDETYGVILLDKAIVNHIFTTGEFNSIYNITTVCIECKARYSFMEMIDSTYTSVDDFDKTFENIFIRLRGICTYIEKRLLDLLFIKELPIDVWEIFCHSLIEILYGKDRKDKYNRIKRLKRRFRPIVIQILSDKNKLITAKRILNKLSIIDSIWEFPRGHKKKQGNEKDMDAAMRELEEEAGIPASLLKDEKVISVMTKSKIKPNINYILKFFLITMDITKFTNHKKNNIYPLSKYSTLTNREIKDDDIIYNKIPVNETISIGLFTLDYIRSHSMKKKHIHNHMIFDATHEYIRDAIKTMVIKSIK
jgi:8-oxo-dGTP pyrophosphatase MutT (NUDIX family)